MSESIREAKAYMVEYLCDDCEKIPNPGCILINTDALFLIYPAKYVYECPNCKKRFVLDKHYPRIDFK